MTKITAAAAHIVRSSGKAVRVSALAAAIGLVAIGTALATTTTTAKSYNSPRYGKILVNGHRFTLYVYCPGTSTVCKSNYSNSNWPPFIQHGKLVAGSGVNKRRLTTRRLSSGQHQIMYFGQPLYQYKGDKKPCQFKGEGRVSGNGSFFVITTSGRSEPTPCYLGSGQGACPPACGS